MLCLFFTLMVSYRVWKNRIEGTIMMKVYICPNCGWLRTVSRRKEVECFKCGTEQMTPVKLTFAKYAKMSEQERLDYSQSWRYIHRKDTKS